MSDSAPALPDGDDAPSLLKRLSQLLRGSTQAAAIRESVEAAIEESERQSPALSKPEQTMLANLLKFGELKVRDVMVPRVEIVAVEEATPLAQLIQLFREAQHSRLPLYRETLDDPIGLVHIKDVLGLYDVLEGGSFRLRDVPISSVKRDVLFVPPSMPLLDLLLKMQTTHIHLALVIDEYGGTDGLVSIEDVIEEIVGDIADEHDEDAVRVRKLDDGSYVVDAKTDLEEFKNQTDLSLGIEEAEEGADTIGGLVVWLLGRVPPRGEIVAHPAGFEFEVLEADPRRVKRVRVRPPANPVKPADETVD